MPKDSVFWCNKYETPNDGIDPKLCRECDHQECSRWRSANAKKPKSKCCRCERPAEGSGKQYVTVKLAGTTIRIEKLKFCKEHGDELRLKISTAVINAMAGRTYEVEITEEDSE